MTDTPLKRSDLFLAAALAVAAAGYPAGTVYALDGGVDLERDGFWAAGAGTSRVLVRPRRGSTATLIVRNAPVPNTVGLNLGGWRRELTLAAGEETRVSLPAGDGVLEIATTAGFRPGETGGRPRPRGRRGGRFLGAWFAVTDGGGPDPAP